MAASTVNYFTISADMVFVPRVGTFLATIKLNTYDTASGEAIPTNLASTPVVNLVDATDTAYNGRVSAAVIPGTGQYRWTYTSTAGDGSQSFRFNLSNGPTDNFRATVVFNTTDIIAQLSSLGQSGQQS